MNLENIHALQVQYREAISLCLWYTGSAYSIHKGKTSKDLAATYRHIAHKCHDESRKILQENGLIDERRE